MAKDDGLLSTIIKTGLNLLVDQAPVIVDKLTQNQQDTALLQEADQRIDDLEDRLHAIEERNKGVEADKAWESSFTRKLSLSILTYMVVGFFLWFINVDRPWINALVPALGFLLSTLTLPFFKQFWKDSIYKPKNR